MNIIWLGHGSTRIEIADQVILIDPWLTGNPMMEGQDAAAAIAGATQILITHGHFDHVTDIIDISKKTAAPVSGMVELVGMLVDEGAHGGHAFNKGGTIPLGDSVRATMVPASHSNSRTMDGKSHFAGTECGFMIQGEDHVIYASGDTAIMADMAWMGAYFKPDIGILSAGGYYTMDMAQAAWAAREYFDFKTLIPVHYRTFPALEQSAQVLADGLPGVDVIEPEVLRPITL